MAMTPTYPPDVLAGVTTAAGARTALGVGLVANGGTGLTAAVATGYLLFGGPTAFGSSASLQFDDTGKALAIGGSLSITEVARTGLTASTPFPSVSMNLAATKTWGAGALSNQADFLITAATHAFSSASTETNAATFAISGPPVAGGNCTQVNPLSLHIRAGRAQFDGNVLVNSILYGPDNFAIIGGANTVLTGSSNLFLRAAAGANIVIDTGAGISFGSGNIKVGGSAGASANKTIALSNSATAPTGSTDLCHLYASDHNGTAGSASLCLFQESALVASGDKAATHEMLMTYNGTPIWVLVRDAA